MNIAIGILALVVIGNACLGLIVYSRNTGARLNQLYLALALTVTAWSLANFLFLLSPDRYLLPLAQAANAAGALMALFFVLFNLEYTQKKVPVQRLVVPLGLFMSALALVPGLYSTGVGPDRSIQVGFGIYAFALYLTAYFIWGMFALIQELSESRGVKKNQTLIMGSGMAVAVSMGLIFNVGLPFFLDDYRFVTLGPGSTLIYLGAIGYAIAKRRLFDIRPLVARSAAYILLFVAVSFLYVGIVFASTVLFLGSAGVLVRHFLYVGAAVFIAFTFKHFEHFFQRVTDRIFYRDRYDTGEVLSSFSRILASELDIDRLMKHSLSHLTQNLHISYGQIVIFDHERVYKMEHVGTLPKRLLVASELRRLNHPILVADELQEGDRKRLLDTHSLRVSAMLRTKEGVIGYLLLGDKLSGDIYSTQDIKLLEIASQELAVSLQNAKAYAQIQAFNATLQERVNHATARLRVANAHLKDLDQAKDEFISMASHQLRTPLTTIKGYLSMILEGDAGPISPTQKEFLEYSFAGSERMVNLISDLLNVSRLSAGRFIIQPKPTDVLAMARDEVRQLESHAAAKGLQLKLEAPEDMRVAEIDENKTRQVVMNFIDNAIYYTQSGSVTVSVLPGRGSFRLLVRDTGIGVPKEAQKKLFTKFFRAENAQGVRPDGTGLGLYLAKRVVEDQGGTIIFESTVGQGSVFGFELPYVAAVTHKADHAKPRIHA